MNCFDPDFSIPIESQVVIAMDGVLQRQKSKDQRAYLMLVVKAGSLHEDDDQRGLMLVWAQAKQGQLPASLDALLTEAERVKRHGFTSTELERMLR